MHSHIRKISRVGGMIFLATALVGVLGGFAILFPQTQSHLHKNLQRTLEARDREFNEDVTQAWLVSNIFASQPSLVETLASLNNAHPDFQRQRSVRAIAESAFRFGFSAIEFRNLAGREIARGGSFVQNPGLDVVVQTAAPSHLLWKDGFVLHTRIEIVHGGRAVGYMEAERQLPQLSRMQSQVYLGNTTDYAVCAKAAADTMNCFPFHSTGGKVLLNLPAQLEGRPIPMSFALSGHTGIIHTRDYRGEEVIAAYEPIGTLGLGSVLKIDADELYQPISSKYKTLLALLLVLIVTGMLLLYKQVLPLVRAMSAEIDERKKAEERLLLFRSLIDQSSDAIEVVDPATLRVLDANQTACGALGYTRDALLAMGLCDFDTVFCRDREGMLASLAQSEQVRFESMRRRKDGSEFPVETSAKRVALDRAYILCISRDISERKIAEQKMQQFKVAIETTHEGFWITDDEGTIQEVNRAYAQLSGYSQEELRGMHVSQLDAIQVRREQVGANIARIIERGWDVFETRHRRKDGSEIEIEVSAAYLPASRQFVAFLHDISQHKEDQRQIAMLNRMYLAMSRINSISYECQDEAELFSQFCQIAVELGGMKMAWIGKPNLPGGRIRPVASFGEGLDYLTTEAITQYAADPEGPGPTSRAFREGRPVIVQDFSSSPLTESFAGLVEKYGWGASACFPVMHNRGVYAAISIYHARKNPFNKDVIDLISRMAEDVGHGLDRLDLEAERQRTEASMRLAATIYESSSEGVMVTDEDNLIIDVNPAFTTITGYSLDEVRGKSPRIFKSGRHDEAFYQEMWQTIRERGHWQGEIWDRRKDGEVHVKWMNISVIRGVNGEISRHVAEFSDITEKKQKDELIWTQANYDALTNLPNRRLLADRIDQAMAVSLREKKYCALIALDLDHFKQLNDTMGHSLGDMLLTEVARRLESCIREGDTVARMGGDEFMVILNDLSDTEEGGAAQADAVAENIRERLSSVYHLGKVEYHTTPSIGVVLFFGHAHSQENLLAHVDTAMYQAKSRGRNTICFFDAGMQEALERRGRLEHALRAALTYDELQLHYQLQVDNHGKAVGAEALLRWNQRELGTVSPAQFIPLAEETGLILPIGHWVLESACAQLTRWKADARTRNLSIAINVSARQFREPAFVSDVSMTMQKYGITPGKLKLELTESLVLENIEEAISKMRELKARGVRFSMDDFGTGYSSLSYLSRLPIDQLKIDQSFVQDITEDSNDATIVHTIISMAHTLGIEVVAEGVETEAQRTFLAMHGCQIYQGFLFCRPLPIAEVEYRIQETV